MKNLFARMSFPRAVILFCSLGSLVLGYLVYQRSQRLDEVKGELKRVPKVVEEIQTDAFRLEEMLKLAGNEKFKKLADSEYYIRQIGGQKEISIGQIKIEHTERSTIKGVLDTVYKITPDDKSLRYTRGQIGNFLYQLEAKSRRVKVTRLKLTPAGKVLPGEIGKDQWVFEADLTTRTKLETTPAPTAPNQG